jgi:hypothetical protein
MTSNPRGEIMEKHTSGPWKLTGHGELIIGRDQIYGEVAIAEAKFNWKANARLISAAPDLLEALQDLVNAQPEASLPILEQARAAIVKATGGETI